MADGSTMAPLATDPKQYPRLGGEENPGDDVTLTVSGSLSPTATLLPESKPDPLGYKLGGNVNLPVLLGINPIDGKEVRVDVYGSFNMAGNFKFQDTPAAFGFDAELGYKQTFARNNITRDAFKLVLKGGVKGGVPPTWTAKGGLVVERDMADGKGTDLRTPILGIDLGLVGMSGFEFDARTNLPIQNVYVQANGSLGFQRSDNKFFFTNLKEVQTGSDTEDRGAPPRGDDPSATDVVTIAGNVMVGGAVMFNTRPRQGQLVRGAPALRIDGSYQQNWDPVPDIGEGQADARGGHIGLTVFVPGKDGEYMRDIATGYDDNKGAEFSDPISAFFIRLQLNLGASHYFDTRFHMPAQCDSTDWDACMYYDDAQAPGVMELEGEEGQTLTRREFNPMTTSLDLSVGGNFLELFIPRMKIPKTEFALKIVPEVGLSIPLGATPAAPVLTGGLILKGTFEDTVGGIRRKQKGTVDTLTEREAEIERREQEVRDREKRIRELEGTNIEAHEKELEEREKQIEEKDKELRHRDRALKKKK